MNKTLFLSTLLKNTSFANIVVTKTSSMKVFSTSALNTNHRNDLNSIDVNLNRNHRQVVSNNDIETDQNRLVSSIQEDLLQLAIQKSERLTPNIKHDDSQSILKLIRELSSNGFPFIPSPTNTIITSIKIAKTVLTEIKPPILNFYIINELFAKLPHCNREEKIYPRVIFIGTLFGMNMYIDTWASIDYFMVGNQSPTVAPITYGIRETSIGAFQRHVDTSSFIIRVGIPVEEAIHLHETFKFIMVEFSR